MPLFVFIASINYLRGFTELTLAHTEELNAAFADTKAKLDELESTHRSELIRSTERLRNDHNTQLARMNDSVETEKAELTRVSFFGLQVFCMLVRWGVPPSLRLCSVYCDV